MLNYIFCIFSNLICILPAYLFYKTNNYYDSLFCIYTGVGSLLYHLNNNSAGNSMVHWFDEQSIRNVDVIMSDLLVINMTTYIIWGTRNGLDRRIIAFITALPFEVYAVSLGNKYREKLLVICCVACFIVRLTINKKNFTLLLGMFISLIDILCYRTLAPSRHHNYNVFHGLHHIAAYSSIAVYFFIHNTPSPTIGRERSNSALIEEELHGEPDLEMATLTSDNIQLDDKPKDKISN